MDENTNEELDDIDSSNLFIYTEEGEVIPATQQDFTPSDFENTPIDTWSIQSIWNEMIDVGRRPPKVRDYISFSDIGKSDYWSRYMKMMGVEETNPYNPRVIRIFEAGNEFHNLLKSVFKRAGILINSQDDLDKDGNEQYSVIETQDGMLKQFGKYDALAGGVPDYERARISIIESDLSPFMQNKALSIAKHLADKFPMGLKPLIYEFKSIHSMAFWGKKSYLLKAYPHHVMQTYGYMKANNIDQGRLLYISKDDMVIAEFPIYLNDASLEKKYNDDIRTMSYYYLNKIEPPKPPYIVYNPFKQIAIQHKTVKYKTLGCYDINWEVIRSPYLTLMTGVQNEKELKSMLKDELKIMNDKVRLKTKARIDLAQENKMPMGNIIKV